MLISPYMIYAGKPLQLMTLRGETPCVWYRRGQSWHVYVTLMNRTKESWTGKDGRHCTLRAWGSNLHLPT